MDYGCTALIPYQARVACYEKNEVICCIREFGDGSVRDLLRHDSCDGRRESIDLCKEAAILYQLVKFPITHLTFLGIKLKSDEIGKCEVQDILTTTVTLMILSRFIRLTAPRRAVIRF